jgi:hypothetical protein
LFEYISGTMQQSGVSAPAEPSPSGVFGIVLQILGLTVDNIRSKVVRLIGPRNAERIEMAWSVVSGLLSGGAEGLWQRVKDFVGDLKERVMGEVTKIALARRRRRLPVLQPVELAPGAALLRRARAPPAHGHTSTRVRVAVWRNPALRFACQAIWRRARVTAGPSRVMGPRAPRAARPRVRSARARRLS